MWRPLSRDAGLRVVVLSHRDAHAPRDINGGVADPFVAHAAGGPPRRPVSARLWRQVHQLRGANRANRCRRRVRMTHVVRSAPFVGVRRGGSNRQESCFETSARWVVWLGRHIC